MGGKSIPIRQKPFVVRLLVELTMLCTVSPGTTHKSMMDMSLMETIIESYRIILLKILLSN